MKSTKNRCNFTIQSSQSIQIAGAGIAGLVAAITLAQAGRKDESCNHVDCNCVWCCQNCCK